MVIGLALQLLARRAGAMLAACLLLTLIAACASSGGDAAATRVAETGGAPAQDPANEPGSPIADVTVSKLSPLDASVRAYIDKQQAKPRGDLDLPAAKQTQSVQVSALKSKDGTPLAALDVVVPPAPLTTYPLSADGKYYNVNLLNRNFLPPSAHATFSSGVRQSGQAAPPLVFDGGDSAFTAIADVPGDPNVTVTLTVDMGQYFSIGAVRPLYQVFGGGDPVSHRIRLASKLGQDSDWTTVYQGAVVAHDATFSFDPQQARFLELTMTGNGCNLLELFVYPSAATSPPPTYASGYDITSIGATQTVNDNFFPLGQNWPVSWPTGAYYPKTAAWGANGDAIGTVDLGAQFPISRISTSFFWSTPWTDGGRLEMGATSDAYTTLRDSGPGHDFGFPLDFTFPTQPIRYLRATDYFRPDAGAPSGQTLWSWHAFATPAPHTGYFPLSADGKYFAVNLVRRPASDPQTTATVTYSNGAVPRLGVADPQRLIDGDDTDYAFNAPEANMPGATATLMVDLQQVQKLGAVRLEYGSYPPANETVRIAPTLSGPWQTVINGSIPPSELDRVTSFDGYDARYVELTMKGLITFDLTGLQTQSTGFANIVELMVYPSSASDTAPSSSSHLDLSYLTGMSVTTNENMGQNGGPNLHSFDGVGGLYVKTVSQGGTGDATATIDLGQLYQVSQLDLAFYGSTFWAAGGKIDLDDGTGNWVNVFDTGRGNPLGSANGGPLPIAFAPRTARYVRIGGYFDPNATTSGLLFNMGLFGDTMPCVASCAGKTCGDDGCGGLCGGACAGSACHASSDCQSGLTCSGYAPGTTNPSICQPSGYPGTCTNGVRDGNETDVDCGGSCGQCASGHGCGADADCGSTLVCGNNNGAYFGKARGVSLCWAATCQAGTAGNCGQPDSACGQNCAGVTSCDPTSATNSCGSGETCATGLGQLFGSSAPGVCVDSRCPSNDPALCGAPEALCGVKCVCTPNCSAATCQNASDGCGGICPGVCRASGNGDTSDTGCIDDIACGAGFACIAGVDGVSRCRPASCAFEVMAPPACGVPGAPCGDQCPACTQACDGRQCGADPKCGQSCGSCGSGTFCDASGQCVAATPHPVLEVPDANGGKRPLPPLPFTPTTPVGVLKGEFSVSEQGSPIYSIPIEVPPGRAGMEPALSLQYSGTRTNGEVGVGWHLEGLSKITRCPHSYALDGNSSPVQNNQSDLFCIDGKRLEGVAGSYGKQGGEYRTTIDSFAKVISHVDTVSGLNVDPLGGLTPVPSADQGPDDFEVWTKDGRKLTFGGTYDSTALGHNGVRYAWLLNEVEDRAGNTIIIKYANLPTAIPQTEAIAPNSLLLPSVISYTGHKDPEGDSAQGELGNHSSEIIGKREVRFSYESRTDEQVRFVQGGAPFKAAKRLSRITTYVDNVPVRNYHVQYADQDLSQVEKVFDCAGGDDSTCKPPTTFQYSRTTGFGFQNVGVNLAAAGQLDVNGDGLPDFMETNVLVGGVPAQPTLKAATIVSDIAVSGAALALDDAAGPEAGFALSITWDIIKTPFWGLFAKEPTITFQHSLHIGTGVGGLDSFTNIADVQGLRCSGDHPAFMLDYDLDGRDDIVSACGTNNGSLYVALSKGDGSFSSYPEDGSPVATVEIGRDMGVFSGGHSYSNAGPLAGPILIDVDGDGLQDIVSCLDQYTVQVHRRVPPPGKFELIGLELPTAMPVLTGPPDHQYYSSRNLDPLCGHTRPAYNFVDIDGDGMADLFVSGPDGWYALRLTYPNGTPAEGGTPQLSWQPVAMPNTAFSKDARTLQLGDFNGDGLADVFGYDDNTYTIWLNSGGGRFYSSPIARPRPGPSDLPPGHPYSFKHLAVLDYNVDGRDDFLENWQTQQYDAGNGNFQTDRFNWVLEPNGRLDQFNTEEVPSIQWLGASNHPYAGDFTLSGDVNGDGRLDLLGRDAAVFYGLGGVTLSRIVDGLGKTIDIYYGSSPQGGGYKTDDRCATSNTPGSSWPEKCLPRMNSIVAGYTEGVIDSAGNFARERYHSYTFTNGRMNVTGLGWLGFDQEVVTTGSTAPDDAGTTTTIDYEPVARFRPNGTQSIVTTLYPYVYPFAGLPRTITVDQHPFTASQFTPPLQNGYYERRTQTVNHWKVQLSTKGRPFPVVDTRTVTTYDRNVPGGPFPGPHPGFDFNGAALLTCNEAIDTDLYGNTLDDKTQCLMDGSFEVEDSETTTTYTPDEDAWLISNPEHVEIEDGQASAATRVYQMTYNAGLLETVTRAPNGPSDAWHKTTYTRDDFGNVKKLKEEAGGLAERVTDITYDNDWVFPQTITNTAGVTQLTFNTHWGALETIVDPSGTYAQLGYDGFGRSAESRDATGSSVTTYTAIPSPNRTTASGIIDPRIEVRVERQGADGTAGGVTSTEMDSYGRPVRTTVAGFAGAQVIQEKVYDQLGRVYSSTLPHTADLRVVPYDRYTYDDVLKRLTRVDHSDGSSKQIQYATVVSLAQQFYGWGNATNFSQGCKLEHPFGCFLYVTRTIDEEQRENVVLANHAGKPVRNVDGENTVATAHSSNFVYGAFGQMIESHDNQDLQTSFQYDDYGRLLVKTDPDIGDTHYTYTGFDELHTRTDPKQQQRTYNFNTLGKLESIADADGLSQWVYDSYGRLSDTYSPTSDGSIGQHVNYSYELPTDSGTRGLLQTLTYTIDGAAYSTGFEYDGLGRPKLVHYPTNGGGQAIIAQYDYDNSGNLTGLDEVGGGSARSLWHLTDAYQGHLPLNEILGDGASATHTTYGYDEQRRWLKSVHTTLGANEIQGLDYTNYHNGLVDTLAASDADPREYLYDNLNRISFENITVQGTTNRTPFTYDNSGNLVVHGSLTNSYRPTQPHLLDSVGSNAYGYDANGNVASRSGPGVPGESQIINYTPFDLPRSIETPNSDELFDSVFFDYTADEERALRREGATGITRHFVADVYQRKLDADGVTQEENFRLYAGDRLIAEISRQNGVDQTLFFHPDRLGSPETVSDNNGHSYHQHFDPFGSAIDPPNEISRVGFTGHDHDNDLGLIDMNGRVYDPLAGRFLTQDPITQAPTWSQGLNHYSYVFNNPINNTDPSGFETSWEGGAPAYWGAATTAIAAGFRVGAVGFAEGAGIAGLNPLTSLFTGQYNIGSGSDPYSYKANAPTVAPKATGANSRPGSGATTDNKGDVAVQERAPLAVPERPPTDTSGYLACYPACALDPNAAFPNEASADAYNKSYDIVGNGLLLADGVVGLGRWALERLGIGAAEGTLNSVPLLARASGREMFGEALNVLKATPAVERGALASKLMAQVQARAVGGAWQATEMAGANGARAFVGEYHTLVVDAAGNVFKGANEGVTFGVVNGAPGVASWAGLAKVF